jgi:hypothetical protein
MATLSGEARITATGGTVHGISLGSLQGLLAAGEPEETAVQEALSGGTTAFTRADLDLRARKGLVEVVEGHLAGPSGTASIGGSVDVPADTLHLRFGLWPAVNDPPEIGLRLSGPADHIDRATELAGMARWRAERASR